MVINGQYQVEGLGRFFVCTLENGEKILMNGDPIDILGDQMSYAVAGREEIRDSAGIVRIAYLVKKVEYEGSFEPEPQVA